MSRGVRVAARARRQIAAVDEWWRANRPDAPHLFSDELSAASALLAASPYVGSRYPVAKPPGVRRLLLLRTCFHVYYTVDAEAVLVRALWHSARGRGPTL